jgi:hypothetical protein
MKAIQSARKNTDATALCIRPSFCRPMSNRFSSSLVFTPVCPKAYAIPAVSLHGGRRHKYIIKRLRLHGPCANEQSCFTLLLYETALMV